jgi:hypothetical protein
VKINALLRMSGLDAERRLVLTAECAAFLRCGGTVTLADWESMSEDGRESMVAAAEVVERSRARVIHDEGGHFQAETIAAAREAAATRAALDAGEAEVAALGGAA